LIRWRGRASSFAFPLTPMILHRFSTAGPLKWDVNSDPWVPVVHAKTLPGPNVVLRLCFDQLKLEVLGTCLRWPVCTTTCENSDERSSRNDGKSCEVDHVDETRNGRAV